MSAISQGRTVAQVSKQLGITDQTYYRWRKEYGGLRTDQAKRVALAAISSWFAYSP